MISKDEYRGHNHKGKKKARRRGGGRGGRQQNKTIKPVRYKREKRVPKVSGETMAGGKGSAGEKNL